MFTFISDVSILKLIINIIRGRSQTGDAVSEANDVGCGCASDKSFWEKFKMFCAIEKSEIRMTSDSVQMTDVEIRTTAIPAGKRYVQCNVNLKR